MIRVLFLCTGNICRSPMADGMMRHLIKQADLEAHLQVDSAGIDRYHVGDPTHQGTVNVLKKHGIHFSKRARLLSDADGGSFHYLIGMTSEHLRFLERAKLVSGNTSAVVARLLDYTDAFAERDVPDPYYSGEFDQVYQMVLAGCTGLLAAIRAEHGI